MTPSEIETMARRQYNAVNDSFWSQAEVMDLIYAACLELSNESDLIEDTFTTTTVAGTQTYSFPTNALKIYRVEYDGQKLQKITQRDDDKLTLVNSNTTEQGRPLAYWIWNNELYLRPIPDDAKQLKVFAYVQAAPIQVTSTLEIPSVFHTRITDFILHAFTAKDKDYTASRYYLEKWEKSKMDVKRWVQKRKRSDSFAQVISEDDSILTPLGEI